MERLPTRLLKKLYKEDSGKKSTVIKMYSQVANTSYSYLLTLDKFRNAIPVEHRPSWVKITTITMVSKFADTIDVEKLVRIFSATNVQCGGREWSMKPTKFYNQITISYTDEFSTKSVKVFPNGSVQVAGCYDLYNCKRVIGHLNSLMKTLLNIRRNYDFRVVMINTNFSLNYHVNLFELAEHFEDTDGVFKVSFNPDRYSAVKIKFSPAEDMKQVTASIFSTGKIIVTGAETLKEIAYSYNLINQHIMTKPELKVKKTDSSDKFDVIWGNDCSKLVSALKERGHTPWGTSQTNYGINF